MPRSCADLGSPAVERLDADSAAVTREAPVLLSWSERSNGSVRWLETAPERRSEQRGVIIWLRHTGQLVWWILAREETLAIGGLASVDPPTPALIERAMQIVERRWLER